MGAVLTVIFTASNVYLGLKVGLTFSSAIPAAVISMAVLRMAKGSNILENNMVQTQASAAGTLSAIIFIVRLIGAGAMGVAAIWTLIKLARPVIDGVKEAIQSARVPQEERKQHRTDTDMSVRAIAIIFMIMFASLLGTFYSLVTANNLPFAQSMIISLVGVLLAVMVGFLVAAACAYMAGLVGTSSSPISGIGILAIIISSLVIMTLCKLLGIFDMPGGEKFATATAIFTTSIVIAIACISNDNMQDLKTGFLVGATPQRQQIALLLGCLAGALVIAPVLNLLYQAYGFQGALPRPDMNPDNALAAPQATLMTMIAQGIFSSNLAWEYIYFGIGLGVVVVIIDSILKSQTKNLCLPPLAVGIGIYLPPSLQTPLVVGAILGYLLEKKMSSQSKETVEASKRRGTLFSSGLIVGESLVGVIIAAIIAVSVSGGGSDSPLALVGDGFASTAEFLGLGVFAATLAIFYKMVRGKA